MTPQEREVMQMALEALTIFREWELGQDYNSNRDTVLQRAFKAEEALRAALAQPEQEKTRSQKMREAEYTKRDTRLECDGCGKKFSRLMLPIHDCESAQPEQEPVAYDVDGATVYIKPPIHNGKYLTGYTAPPQREWQGLTDEETADLIWKSDWEPQKIARAIEAKLKEKNT